MAERFFGHLDKIKISRDWLAAHLNLPCDIVRAHGLGDSFFAMLSGIFAVAGVGNTILIRRQQLGNDVLVLFQHMHSDELFSVHPPLG